MLTALPILKWSLRFCAVGAGLAAIASAYACSDATGFIQGGGYILPFIDAGAASSSAGLPAACVDGGANSGNAWSDLYACYFGSSGIATCANGATGGCHGGATEFGAVASGGFFCPIGTDPTPCYQSLVSTIVPDGGAPDAASTTLYGALRKTGGTCDSQYVCMPLSPATLIFQQSDLDRISAWIQAGAPNN